MSAAPKKAKTEIEPNQNERNISLLDKIEQASKIFATALIPVIVALGGWWIQSTIESDKQRAANIAADQQRAADEQKVSLEYVKLAKEILTSEKPLPKELTKWSWGLIDQVSPRKFAPEDLQNVITSDVRIPTPPSERSIQRSPVKPSALDGFVISVLRARTERRPGASFSRTIGYYHVFFKGQKLPGLEGMTVERQGPGDNSMTGVQLHRRLESGVYPLYTHSSDNYNTNGYADNPTMRPRPAIGIEDTGLRRGIVIHPASGYSATVGTVNLSKNLDDAAANIEFQDSRQRVIALIEAMKEKLGGSFPKSKSNDEIIPNAWIIIAGEPVSPDESDSDPAATANQ